MFVLASSIAGIAGGGIAIFFWKAARYCIGAWGGLAFGWWIQCFHDGGVIKSVGLRWLLFIGKRTATVSLSSANDIDRLCRRWFRSLHDSQGACTALLPGGPELTSTFQIHYHILLISTAFVGSSAFILGVDCFTTAGLKEVSLNRCLLDPNRKSSHLFSSTFGTWVSVPSSRSM